MRNLKTLKNGNMKFVLSGGEYETLSCDSKPDIEIELSRVQIKKIAERAGFVEAPCE